MDRLARQLDFIKEIDKLKSVMRRSLLITGERYENSAEHSWHFALMALVLAEYYPHIHELNMLRVLKMALIHDLVEIYAGDTYCYDEAAGKNQEENERKAADRLFGLLPPDQGLDLINLWHEFEAGVSHEARFARVIDRLSPFMLNFYSGGISWKKHGVRKSQVLHRMGEIEESCPEIWQYVIMQLATAVDNGWIIDDR